MERIDLHALADGELSAEQTSELRRELDDDVRGMAEFESIVALKQCLGARAIRHECRVEWNGCVSRIRELERSRRVERVVGRYSWALCGAFFLFILAGGIAHRGLSGNRVGSEDIVQAATSLMPTRMPPKQNSQAVNAYLDALLGKASQSLAPDRLDIRGGAIGEINGHPASRLTLRDADGDMALIVVSDQLDFDGMPTLVVRNMPIRYGTADGINLVAWQMKGVSAILIGERDHQELANLAQRISIR